MPAYLADAGARVTVVGTVTEPDLERIAAQRPDLILGTESRHAALYDRLATIRDWENSISVDLSPELVQQARADEVFLTATDPASPSAVPPAVEAVRAQVFPRLHPVDQSVWITGIGPLGGQKVLDDIERTLGR